MEIQWYWAKPDAAHYPYGHCWEPAYLNADKAHLEDVVGEIPYESRITTAGKNPGVVASGMWCGTEADFAGEGIEPRLPNGRPDFAKVCGCSYRLTVGIGVKRWKRYKAKLGLHATFKRYHDAGTFTGSLGMVAVEEIPQVNAGTFTGSLGMVAVEEIPQVNAGSFPFQLALRVDTGDAALQNNSGEGTLTFNSFWYLSS